MIYFLIPIYNDANNILNIIKEYKQFFKKKDSSYLLLFINDCSSDNIKDIFSTINSPKVKCIHFDHNRGPGAVIKDAIHLIAPKLKDDDIVIVREADQANNGSQTLHMMLNKMHEGYDVVTASIFAPGGRMVGVPFHRFLMTQVCNALYRIFFYVRGVKLFTIFFRAYRGQVLRQLVKQEPETFISSNGFGFSSELLVKCIQNHYLICEVPIVLRLDLNQKKSTLKIKRTLQEHIRIIRNNL